VNYILYSLKKIISIYICVLLFVYWRELTHTLVPPNQHLRDLF